jgi:hypothetical protein
MLQLRLRGTADRGTPGKRTSYANVAATLALVLAIGGGTAVAASSYLITSTHQIKPSVLKSLRGPRGFRGFKGANGTNGANGANGAKGSTGATGATGANLTAQTALPSGQSESGFYAAAGGNSTSGFIGTGISYTQPLATPIATSNIIWNKAGTTSPFCSGYGHAAPGYLCLYDNEEAGVTGVGAYSTGFSAPSAGVILYWGLNAAPNYVSGEYTVTAP